MRIGAAQTQNQPLHRLTLTAPGDKTITGQTAEAHLGHIGKTHNLAGSGRADDDGTQIIERFDTPFHPHQQAFLAFAQAPGTVIAVIALQGPAQIVEIQSSRLQGSQIGNHLETAHVAPQRIHIGNTGQGAQLRPDDPVEQAAFLRQRQLALDSKHQHFAQRGRHRRQPTADPGGKIGHRIGQAFAHLLAGPVNVGAVGKIESDVGDRIFCNSTQRALLRNTEQFQLDRRHDACFHLLRRHSGRLDDDLHLR